MKTTTRQTAAFALALAVATNAPLHAASADVTGLIPALSLSFNERSLAYGGTVSESITASNLNAEYFAAAHDGLGIDLGQYGANGANYPKGSTSNRNRAIVPANVCYAVSLYAKPTSTPHAIFYALSVYSESQGPALAQGSEAGSLQIRWRGTSSWDNTACWEISKATLEEKNIDLTDGNYHHFVFLARVSDKKNALYVDGVQVWEAASSNRAFSHPDNPFYAYGLGCRASNVSSSIDSKTEAMGDAIIDDLRIYCKADSAADADYVLTEQNITDLNNYFKNRSNVAKRNNGTYDYYYADWPGFAAAVLAGDTVTALANATLDADVAIAKDVTLDLGGYTLSGTGSLAFSGTVSVAEGTDLSAQAVTFGEGATVRVVPDYSIAAGSAVFKMKEGAAASVVYDTPIYTVGSSTEGGVTTYTTSYKSGVYVWTGAAGDKRWMTSGNWSVGGETLTDSASKDSIIFAFTNSVDELNIANGDSNINTKYLDIPSGLDVVLTGGGTLVFADVAMPSVGTLTLSNATFRASNSADTYVTNALHIAANTTNTLIPPKGKKLNLYGSLSGSGTLQVSYADNAQYASVEFYASTAAFAGHCIVNSNGKSEQNRFHTTTASVDNQLSSWDIYMGKNKGSKFVFSNSGTYKFGALRVNMPSDSAPNGNITLETGWLNEGCYYNGPLGRSDKSNGITWYGESATFTNAASNVSWISLQRGGRMLFTKDAVKPSSSLAFKDGGGTVAFDDDVTDTDLSGAIKNSTAPIAVEIASGKSETWRSQIVGTNTGGFTKKGAGELTLSAAPLYTGNTTIEAGTLVTPVSATKTYTLASKDATLKITDSADGATITIPANFFGNDEAQGKAGAAVYAESGEPTFVFAGESKNWSAKALGDGWYQISNMLPGLLIIVR